MERKEYEKHFNREELIDYYVNTGTHFDMEHHFLLEDKKIKWIKTTAEMMKNPYTGDIEAVRYVYNINAEKVSQAIISEVAEHDYDMLAFVYDQPEHYIYVDRDNPRDAKERENFYENLRQDIIEDQPDNLEETLAKVTKEAVTEALEKKHSYSVFYTANLEDGKRSRKKLRFVNYSKQERIMFVNQRDVTDIFELEEKSKEELSKALIEARKANAAKTVFLANMSHDMRTPMNGILGLANLMRKKDNLEKLHADVDQIQISGQYLLRLINDTLDMNEIEAGRLELHPTKVHCREVLDNIIFHARLMAKDKGLELKVSAPETLKKADNVVYTDQTRIEQILMNIISNAVMYTPAGGTIEIIIENLEITEDSITDRYIIRDTGIGMSEEFLPRIFDAFSQEGRIGTERQNGTGLGMTIVKQLVDMMDGKIQIDSKPDKGTCVTLQMQYKVYKEEETCKRTDPIDLSILKGKRILICEDHPLNMQIARMLLENQGMLVTEAENGKIGVDLFTKEKEGTFDAIIMDIRMPVMDGLEATRKIRESNKNDAAKIPIIALTANAFEDDVKQCLDAGMNAHLAKPVAPKLLYSTIEKYVRS